MYLTCKKYLQIFRDFSFEEVMTNGVISEYHFKDADLFYRAMDELSRLEILKDIASKLKDDCGDTLHFRKHIVYANNIADFNQNLKILIERMSTIVDIGNSVGFSEIEYGFDIKLPPNLTLSQLSDCISDINKILNQCPYLNVAGERIEFKNVDVGSTWFEFLTVCAVTTAMTTGILLNLGKLVEKAIDIASKLKGYKEQVEMLKSMKIKNSIGDKMADAFNDFRDELIDNSCEQLEKEINSLQPEESERCKLSLSLLSNWVSKGMEIYSCLEAPQKIKDFFPTQEQHTAFPEPIDFFGK